MSVSIDEKVMISLPIQRANVIDHMADSATSRVDNTSAFEGARACW
jgi:hypothetical protein